MEIKQYEIPEDIVTFYVMANPFPAGIQQSYNNLEKIVLSYEDKKNGRAAIKKADDKGIYRTGLDDWDVYGVTETVAGKVVYKACAREHYPGEGNKYQLPSYIIPKGIYLYATIENWQSKTGEVGGYFHQLFQHPDVKQNGICVEYYKSADEMLIMVQHK